VGGLQVAYRKDLFKAHGLPTDRAAVSRLWPTWQAFIDTGKTYVSKLTTSEKTSCKVKKVCYGFIDNAGTMYPAILNQGAKKYYETNGTLIYKTNANVKTAFTTTATAMNSGISTRINQFTSDWNAGMMKGVFATVLAPAWMLDYIKQQAPSTAGKWDVADLPGGGGNLGGSQLTVPTAAKHPAEAKAFIAWYLSPAIQLEIFKRYGLFPSASSLYNNPALTGYKDKFFGNAPIGQIYVTGARQLRPIFEGKNQRAIDNYFGQALAKVAVGKMTASAAWSDAIAQIDKNIRN
jgi:cellobiose transport system substrate-binding protein